MMIFILKILSPRNIPNLRTEWGWRLQLYYWLIKTLLPLYKRSAFSDTIIVGNTQVIHNVRNYWYEQELHRFHLDAAFSIEKRSIPFIVNRKYKLSRFFNWSDSLLILHEGGSYSIKRDKEILIDADIEGILKSSTERDFIFCSEFVEKSVRLLKEQTNNKIIDLNSRTKSSKQKSSSKITIKDTVPTNTLQTPEFVKHQGFEENNLF